MMRGRLRCVAGSRAGRPGGAGRSWLSWLWGGNAGAQAAGREAVGVAEGQQPCPCQCSCAGGADHCAAQAVAGCGQWVSWAAGQVSEGDPDGGGVGKVPYLRKPIMNNAQDVEGPHGPMLV